MFLRMKNRKLLFLFSWWLLFIVVLLVCFVFCESCSVLAVTAGKAHSSVTTTTTTTTIVDSNKVVNPFVK